MILKHPLGNVNNNKDSIIICGEEPHLWIIWWEKLLFYYYYITIAWNVQWHTHTQEGNSSHLNSQGTPLSLFLQMYYTCTTLVCFFHKKRFWSMSTRLKNWKDTDNLFWFVSLHLQLTSWSPIFLWVKRRLLAIIYVARNYHSQVI